MRGPLLCLLLLLGNCASQPSQAPLSQDQDGTDDRYEGFNRKMFAVNHAIDRNALKPVAVAYRSTVPGGVRVSLHNVLSDIGNPVQFANDVLQGKTVRASNTFMRFLINSTVGVGGLFDVATKWGFPDHDTDFGITLALWGVPHGAFLYLPILGPTNPRDAIGIGVSTVLDPFTWVSFGGSATFGWARYGLSAVDGRSRLLNATNTIDKTALDPYATYRSLYNQHRDAEIERTREADTDRAPAQKTK